MKQKMSRASGVDCAAAAFANGRGLSCSPASRFYELAVGRAGLKIFKKSACIFSTTRLYYASTVFVADWSSG